MEIRKTVMDDLDKVMEIYDNARGYMRENGNANQWINGYPSIELIKRDIIEEKSYVCVDYNQISGVFYFKIGSDPTYLNIYEGNWISHGPYGVVHRIASANRQKGVASYCLNWCFDKCPDIRIDTHKDNFIMQNFLIKNGFTRCGIIYLEDGAERIAYQKAD
ncbi:MAG: GNAT family N-acetyltransferase [Anaerolineaceae bacterium]|nr:MAG: GNAT family N-acetyltransferase [Anaerolineaceae bacterium]